MSKEIIKEAFPEFYSQVLTAEVRWDCWFRDESSGGVPIRRLVRDRYQYLDVTLRDGRKIGFRKDMRNNTVKMVSYTDSSDFYR